MCPIDTCKIMFDILIYQCGWSFSGRHTLFYSHDVTIIARTSVCHFLILMTTVRQPAKRRCRSFLTFKTTFHWWTRQRINYTLIVADRLLRLIGNETIPDSAKPRLELFCLVHADIHWRSIYPSLGIRQLCDNVTMGWWRHNSPA